MRARLSMLALVVAFAAVSAIAAIQLPNDITVEASGPHGAIVQFSATATGNGGDDHNGRPATTPVAAVCSPASGSTFPLGATLVQCSGTTSDGTSSGGSFQVTVTDTTAPSLHLPRFVSAQAVSNDGAVVTFDASAHDSVDGARGVDCAPASGSLFRVGLTVVSCSAADSRGNRTSGSFEVNVAGPPQPPPPPPPPPTLPDVVAEAEGPNGAVVAFSVSGGGNGPDDHNGRPGGSASCAPASGSVFAIGITQVSCGSAGTFNVIVRDTTAPALSLPANINATAGAGGTVTVDWIASASDTVSGSVGVICWPASGSSFGVGTTTVSCSASDGAGNNASGSFDVTVTAGGGGGNPDTTAPVITSITATPNTLRPPNNSLVTIALEIEATDDQDPAPVSRAFDVTANELIDRSDWAITGPLTLQLRATRAGSGSGRIYTVWVESIDASGNRSVGTVTVTVPHDGNDEPANGGKQKPKSK